MSLNVTRQFVHLALVAAICLQPVQAAARLILSRSDRAARGVFAVLLAREPQPGRCRYGVNWSEEQIPDFVAAKEFPLPVRAGLVAPSAVGDFQEVVDPDHRMPSALFCSQDEFKAYSTQRIGEFEKGSDETMQIDRTTFSYPVFDLRRRRAVVIVLRQALEGRFRRNEKVYRHPAGSYSEAVVFVKAHGRWRFKRSTMTGIS